MFSVFWLHDVMMSPGSLKGAYGERSSRILHVQLLTCVVVITGQGRIQGGGEGEGADPPPIRSVGQFDFFSLFIFFRLGGLDDNVVQIR